MNREPWQQRVVDEKAALDDKIEKLENFMASRRAEDVDRYDLILLRDQLRAMREYSAVLDDRISRFR